MKYRLLLLVLFSGCGIFTPRDDFQQPKSSGRIPDPFSFSSLLDSTSERFTNLGYDELFSDQFRYVDINQGESREFSKEQMKTRLRQIENLHNQDSLVVIWQDGDIIKNSDTIHIDEISYAVFFSGTEGNPHFSGTSNMVIVKNGHWQIHRWKDHPSSINPSFFSPVD